MKRLNSKQRSDLTLKILVGCALYVIGALVILAAVF